jgi:hypothetical protein
MMTYREFIRSGLPPAPEPDDLKKLRRLTMVACFSSALALFIARSFDNQPPLLAVVSLVGGVVALSMLVVFARLKFCHDLAYWTPDRVAVHRGEAIPMLDDHATHLLDTDRISPDRPLVR